MRLGRAPRQRDVCRDQRKQLNSGFVFGCAVSCSICHVDVGRAGYDACALGLHECAHLYTGDGRCRVWDLQTGECRHEIAWDCGGLIDLHMLSRLSLGFENDAMEAAGEDGAQRMAAGTMMCRRQPV